MVGEFQVINLLSRLLRGRSQYEGGVKNFCEKFDVIYERPLKKFNLAKLSKVQTPLGAHFCQNSYLAGFCVSVWTFRLTSFLSCTITAHRHKVLLCISLILITDIRIFMEA